MIALRSPIVQLGVRMIGPPALVIGAYLLFAGHNRPGGGFAAGLVFGAVVTLRSVAGLSWPRNGAALISIGIAIVTATAALPMVWGDTLLDQRLWTFDLPLFGSVKTGTAFVFDIGVTGIVVGLIIALLDGLPTTDAGPSEVTQ